MIPRLKPFLGRQEFSALFRILPDAVAQYEAGFAEKFEARHAIAFPYGRSALWAFFKALGIENAEVIQPAYTCVVVTHATVLSGNIPRFVDIRLEDYNMDLEQVSDSINERTRVIIATHLFGYPLNVEQLDEIVRAAEVRYGHKIWVIQDCAHSFGARWRDRSVCNAGDAGLFGLNISKMITSIFGGMLTVQDDVLAGEIRNWRDSHFHRKGISKSLQRSLYLLAVYPAFNEALYGLVYWMQEKTPFLNLLTKAYHLDKKIHFPPDFQDHMLEVEARVGLAQLGKYGEILRLRQETVEYYHEHLQDVPGVELPPLIDGATYSHYVIRVPDRQLCLREMARHGVQLGQLIEYSVPHMLAYQPYATDREFPNSLFCSEHTINLPVHAHLSIDQRIRVIKHLLEVVG